MRYLRGVPRGTKANAVAAFLLTAAWVSPLLVWANPSDGGTDDVPRDGSQTAGVVPEDGSESPPATEPESLPTTEPDEQTSVAESPPPAPSGELDATLLEDIENLKELDLEELLNYVVVSATKSGVTEDRDPAITTVISREEIARWGYGSVAEALNHVVGVYTVDDHIVPNVAVRGVSGGLRAESGLIKVMIDGRPVAFRSTSGNWLGPELIPLSAVQQIEVVRGPASALYGADAFLGIVNIVTRRGYNLDGGEIGMYGNRAGRLGWGQDLALGRSRGAWEMVASLRLNSEDRSGLRLPLDSPGPRLPANAPADRVARGLLLDSTVGLARLVYRPTRRAAVSLTGYLSQIERGAEFADWAQLTHNLDAGGGRSGTNISLRHGTVDLTATLQVSPTLDLRLSGLFFAGGPTSRDRIEVASDMYYVKRDFGYTGFDTQVEASWRPTKTLSILWNAGWILDHEKLPVVMNVMKTSFGSLAAGDERSPASALGSVNLSNGGTNAQIVWTPGTRLTAALGARYDYHNVYGGKPSARAGLVFALRPDLHLKLLYGGAFKAPSPQLLYASPLVPGDIAGNALLKPAYVHTVESQLAYRPNRYLLLTTGPAYSYLLNQAEFVQSGLNRIALNIAEVEAVSWETELRLDYRKQLTGYANVALNRTLRRLQDDGYVASLTAYRNAGYPVLIGHAGVSAAPPQLPLRLSVELSYVSSRPSTGSNTIAAGRRYELPAYTTLGASLRWTSEKIFAKKETAVMLSVRNLTGAHIVDPGFGGVDYPQLGRTFMLLGSQQW